MPDFEPVSRHPTTGLLQGKRSSELRNPAAMRNSTGLWFMSRLLLLLLTACLCDAGAVGAAESPYYLEARKRYEDKEYLLAMLAAEKAVREDGENAGHRYLYGAVLAELKQFSDAEAHLRKAVSLDGQNAEYLYQLGRVLLEQSHQAVIRRGMSAGVRMSRSEAVDSEGLALLERAVELDGGSWRRGSAWGAPTPIRIDTSRRWSSSGRWPRPIPAIPRSTPTWRCST